MTTRISLMDKVRHILDRGTGIPIETDLTPYLATARRARDIDTARMSDREILDRAKALEPGSEAPGTHESETMAVCLALACEASRRWLGLVPFEEQVAAAAVLCHGKVSQLQTGEGKTLAAALAGCHHARRDGSLHIITANDYLARRDAEWMRPVYESLGISVSSIVGSSTLEERRIAYRADVVYLTARELGFDYLRDGLAYSADETVQREFRSAIVDEADFILIDEARIPLVISGLDEGRGRERNPEAVRADHVARTLIPGTDYTVDPEGRRVGLTLTGQEKIEAAFGSGGIHEEQSAPLFARVHAALHAHRLLVRDVDYVVKNGEVKLVDAFTGRVAEKRQWPWGIQAALEAKEGLVPGPEGRIYGSIAVQHLMGLFPRIAAMTATAVPAAEEFFQAYGMGTVVIPPVKPSRRRDEPDRVFWNLSAKRKAVVDEIAHGSRAGRPILVGTASIRESEELAAALRDKDVPCVILNAKNDEEEAGLVAAAGHRGAVTISTNMAGRGTDIRLGEGMDAPEIGGLYVIGTNKHESRRVDDQLRGRSGRQGDPGRTRFFISLEDGIFERYGVREFLPAAYRRRDPEQEGEIVDRAVTREIDRAQAIIEGQNTKIRRSLRKYSLVLEYDRRYVRQLRDAALLSCSLPPGAEEAIAALEASGLAAGPDGVDPSAALRPVLVRTFLARLDSAWADHLALAEDVKEGLGLLRLGGRDPGIEYVRFMAAAFEKTMADLIDATIEDYRTAFGKSLLSEAPADLPARPASTWTYAVEEDALPGYNVSVVSGAEAVLLGPLALPVFLMEQGIRRLAGGKARREKNETAEREPTGCGSAEKRGRPE